MKIDVTLGEKPHPRIAPPVHIKVAGAFGDDPKNIRRYCRLKRLGARVLDRGERIRDKVGLSKGLVRPNGVFETDHTDNFRYCRQILACLRDADIDQKDQRRNLIAVARYMRLDETKYRGKFNPFP